MCAWLCWGCDMASQSVTSAWSMLSCLVCVAAQDVRSRPPATELKAPAIAKKAYGKGAEALRRTKYPEARRQFEEAVRIYPEYAFAWSELGGVLQMLGQTSEARTALTEAVRADRRYLKPLVQLAALEASQKPWPECIQAADAAIALNAIEFPGAYYCPGAGAFAGSGMESGDPAHAKGSRDRRTV